MISVIIPAYNTKDYILKAIDSVKMQTFQDYEIIVIDDMSSDGTRELLETVKDIKLIKNNHKRLAGGSRNAGLDVAVGEYILFLDSDDEYCDKNDFKMISDYLKGKPDILFMGYKTTGGSQFIPNRRTYTVEITGACAVWNKCWKHSFIGKYRFNELKLSAEDREFTDYLCLQEGVTHNVLSKIIYRYTKNRVGSITERRMNE